jgi:hypothetical protein
MDCHSLHWMLIFLPHSWGGATGAPGLRPWSMAVQLGYTTDAVRTRKELAQAQESSLMPDANDLEEVPFLTGVCILHHFAAIHETEQGMVNMHGRCMHACNRDSRSQKLIRVHLSCRGH